VEGLWVCSALGGRGIASAPLAGRLLAARMSGGAWPMEASLAAAVDPARWLVRAARRG
jgi:tRNA 5-methylaminomethyl-2-thiouridine biosynthesis bifunctional protein